MSASLIDGKGLAARIRERVSVRAASLRDAGHTPSLVAVLIGDDPSAASYARSQARHAESVGIDYQLRELPADADEARVSRLILGLGGDPAVSGIMLHLPVPRHLDGFALQQLIPPGKDVEGVGAANLGLLAMGREALIPCTAAAAFACLKLAAADITGREAVVVGRSIIVGKPLAMLMLGANATVTQCHTRTRDLAEHTRRGEILLVSAGVAGLIGSEHVAPGAIVIDIGTHRVSAGENKMKTVGDVLFDEVAQIAGKITPVPGGVGPVTVAKLLSNTIDACERGTLEGT